MISTLWFLIKSALFIGAFIALLTLGGQIVIEAFGYSVTTSLGVFVILSLVGLYALSIVWRLVKAVLFAPKTLSASLEKRSQKTGMQSLTYGLSAVAAGDVKAATYYTKKATKLLKDDYGLVALLAGLTARLKGDEKQAEASFKSLLTHDETTFLGIRGLLQTALDKGDDRYARVLAKQAYDKNPRQPWVIKTLYGLELKHKNYDECFILLKQAERLKIFEKAKIKRDRAALYLEMGNSLKAYKTDPEFLPVVIAVLKIWAREGRRRKSMNLIKKIWARSPHPDLLDLWIPLKKANDAQRIMGWVEDLQRLNPENASANLYVAEIALRYQLNAQAKRFLGLAIESKPTIRAYQLMARVDLTGEWNDLIGDGSSDKAWVCCETGQIYDQWQAFNGQGDFNTIEWAYPQNQTQKKISNDSYPFFLTGAQAA